MKESADQQGAFAVSRCAKRWDVSADTVRRAIKAGKLHAINIMGRVLVPWTEVQRVEAEGINGRRNYAKAR